MEEFDVKYFELYGMAEEANEEMKRLMTALPKMSNEIYSISAKLLNKYSIQNKELASINIAKEKLMEINALMRHLQRLAAVEKRIEDKLEILGCRRAKLHPFTGNGCKPRGTSPTMNLHICKLLDELSAVAEESKITKHKINKVRNAIDVMPTARYREILLKKYITKEKTTQRDWNLRYCFLNAAYLEFFTEYFRLLKNF